jgi:hypothetical protein
MARSSVRHLVLEANWRQVGESLFRLPGANVVASFYAHQDATNDCRRREAEARRRVRNPFCVLGPTPATQATMPEPVLRDYLMDAGIDPPVRNCWAMWWDSNPVGWTERQRETVWQVLDRVRFYTVVATPVLYAVVDPGDRSDWAWRSSSDLSEGVRVEAAFRSRDRADAYSGRGNPTRVIEVPFSDGPAVGTSVTAVVRRAAAADGTRSVRLSDSDRGLPEAVFADRAKAVADRNDREVVARPLVNPFRFSPVVTRMNTRAADDLVLALLELGTRQPAWPGYAPRWVEWWDSDDPTDAVRAAVWAWADLRFYNLVTVPLDPED